jgi:hypothetical protein
VFRPGNHGYSGAVATFDPRRDSLQPLAVVEVLSDADVQATLAFAERYRLPVRPRSGGHSYVGASTGNKVLVVDTAKLKAVHLDASLRTVQVGAGALLGAVHTTLDKHNRTLPTGTCPTVGVTGLALGGGIGAESRLYGLTLDSIASIRVVTADGQVRQVTADSHPDLFWALRGGGGGNFGVVTQFVLNTSVSHGAEFFFLRWSAAHAAAVVEGWQHRLAAMPRSSWANVHLDASGGTVVPRIVGLSWGASGRAEARALIASVGAQPVAASYATYSHPDAVRVLAGSSGSVRQSWVAGSDVLNRPLTSSQAKAVVDVVRERGASRQPGSLILDPLNGAVHDTSTREAAFPWRKALASMQWYVGLPSHVSSNMVSSGRSFIKRGHEAVGAASAGGYLNYLEPSRPLKDYYGTSWTQLVKTAKKYDPSGVLASPFTLPS